MMRLFFSLCDQLTSENPTGLGKADPDLDKIMFSTIQLTLRLWST